MGQGTEEQLTSQIAGTREELSRDVDALYDKVSPGRIVERRKEAVRGRLSSAKDSVMGSAQSAGGSAQSAVGTIERRTQGAPLAAGLVAFGAGMIVAALIPASDKEARAAQTLTDAVKDSPVTDEVKSAGQEIGQHLKESAAEAAQEVRASAQDSASTVKEEGQSAAQTVRQETPGA